MPAPLRILFLLHQYFPRHVGGTEVLAQGLARRFQRQGHSVRIITCHESDVQRPEDFCVERHTVASIPVREVHFNLSVTPHPARCEYANDFTAQAVIEELDHFQPDVVHVLHVMKLSGAAVRACTARGYRVVVTLCDYWFLCPRHTLLQPDGSLCAGPDDGLKCVPCVQQLHGFAQPGASDETRDRLAIAERPRYLRDTLLSADRILALSSFQKQKFVENGMPAERIDVIEHGVEMGAIASRNVADRHPWLARLGFVGSLVPHKGVHVLLEALKLVPRLPVELRVHGGLRENDDYSACLRVRAMQDARIRLLGAFQPQELSQLLNDLDLLAAPAQWYDNDPIIVKTALALGLPVLASRLGSLAEMIRPRGDDWLVTAADPRAWADALLRLAARPAPAFSPVPIKSMDTFAAEMLAVYASLTRKAA